MFMIRNTERKVVGEFLQSICHYESFIDWFSIVENNSKFHYFSQAHWMNKTRKNFDILPGGKIKVKTDGTFIIQAQVSSSTYCKPKYFSDLTMTAIIATS